jgi:hypothetical protein
VLPAILRFKRRVVLMQGLVRGFLSRVRNANTYNANLWDKVAHPPADHPRDRGRTRGWACLPACAGRSGCRGS